MTDRMVMSPYPRCRGCRFLLTRRTRDESGPVDPGGCRKIVFTNTGWTSFLGDDEYFRSMQEAQDATAYREGTAEDCPVYQPLKESYDPQKAAQAKQQALDAFADTLGDPFDD